MPLQQWIQKKKELSVFKSWDKKSENILLREIARATSAAPTFFKPITMIGPDGKKHTYSDGGTAANNPSLVAYDLCLELNNNRKPVVLISINTGNPEENNITKKPTGPQNIIGQVKLIIESAMKAQDQQANKHLELLSTAFSSFSFFSLRVPISHEIEAMDKSENIEKLEEAARSYMNKNKDQFNALNRALKGIPAVQTTCDGFRIRHVLTTEEQIHFHDILYALQEKEPRVGLNHDLLLLELKKMELVDFVCPSEGLKDSRNYVFELRYPASRAGEDVTPVDIIEKYLKTVKEISNEDDLVTALSDIYNPDHNVLHYDPKKHVPFLASGIKECLFTAIRLKIYCEKNSNGNYKQHRIWPILCQRYHTLIVDYNKGIREWNKKADHPLLIGCKIGEWSCISFSESIIPFSFESYITRMYHYFKNRSDEQAKRMVIHGAGGMGKSTLAAQYVKEALENNAYDLVVWINAENEEDIKNKFLDVIREIDDKMERRLPHYKKFSYSDQIPLNEIKRKLDNYLCDRHNEIHAPLFIFDNAPGYRTAGRAAEGEPVYANVAPYLPNVGNVIVTTQTNPGRISNAVRVGCFSPSEAVSYIQKEIKAPWSQESTRTLMEKVTTAGLSHPFVVSSWCQYMNHFIDESKRVATSELILENLNFFTSERGLITLLEKDQFIAFKNMFDTSYTALTEEEKHVFNFLSYLDGEDIKIYDCAYLLSSTILETKETSKGLTIYNVTFGTLADKGFITVQYGQHELESATISPFYKRLGQLKINQDNATKPEEEKITENTFLKIFVKYFKFLYESPSRFSLLFFRYKDAIGLKNLFDVFDKNGTRRKTLFNHLGINVEKIMSDITNTKGLALRLPTLSDLPDFVIDSLAKRIINDPSEDADLPTFKEIIKKSREYGVDEELCTSIQSWINEQRYVFNDRSIPTVCAFLTDERFLGCAHYESILNLSKRLKIRKLLLTHYPTTEPFYGDYEDYVKRNFEIELEEFYDYMRYFLSIDARWSVRFINVLKEHENLFKKLNKEDLRSILFDFYHIERKILFKENYFLTPNARKRKREYSQEVQDKIDNLDSQGARNLLQDIINYPKNSTDPEEKKLFNQQMLKYEWFKAD